MQLQPVLWAKGRACTPSTRRNPLAKGGESGYAPAALFALGKEAWCLAANPFVWDLPVLLR